MRGVNSVAFEARSLKFFSFFLGFLLFLLFVCFRHYYPFLGIVTLLWEGTHRSLAGTLVTASTDYGVEASTK